MNLLRSHCPAFVSQVNFSVFSPKGTEERRPSGFLRLVVLVAVLCFGSAGAWAATCTVTSNADTNTSSPNTLRYCLNNFAAGDTIDFSVTGQITLTSALPSISQNVTITGPGANQLTISGGGSFNVFSITSGTVTISGLKISGGSTAAGGGAISQASGSLTVTGCEFTNNSASTEGGAISAEGSLTVSNSTFTNNSAQIGGAIVGGDGLTLTNSTFSGNSASFGMAGAVYGGGGGTTVTITNNTFYGNSTQSNSGSAIAVGGTAETIDNNLFVNNSGGVTIVDITEVASASNNVFYGNSGADCPSCATNSNGVDATANPLSVPLGYYGGPTRTFLPQPGSQALCAGSASLATAASLTADQRGFAMNPTSYTPCAAGSVDAGAVQANYIQVQASTDAGAGASDCQGTSCTLRDAIALANSNGYGDIDFAPGISSITVGSTGTLTLSGTTGINIVGPGASALLVAGSNVGGSLFTVNASVPAFITELSISFNVATTGEGAGIQNNGSLTVSDSTFQNDLAISGGGIANNGTLVVTSCLFYDDTTLEYGGGLFNNGTLTITDSTFYGNSAGEAGGGISNQGTMTAVNNTVSGNSNDGHGGGISDVGTSTYQNNIVSGNISTASNIVGNVDCSGPSCPVNGTGGNLVGGTVNLSAPGGFGGSTTTMIPEPGSPAICDGSLAAATSAGLTTDERGLPITGGGYCPSGSIDSGAVQTNYSMFFSTDPPSSATIDQGFGAVVTLNESGTPFSGSSVNIPLTISSGTLSGTTTESSSAGLATYSGLSATLGSNLTLSATIPLNLALTTPLSLTATSSGISIDVAPTAVALTPASQSSSVNQSLTFTATVSPNVTSEVVAANVIPITGAVAFSVGGQQISNCGTQPITYNPATGTAAATCTTSTLLAGTSESITAVFTPGGSNGSDYEISPASPQVTATVSQATTTTSVVATPNPSAVNQQVAFTATVTPQNPGTTLPSGTVSLVAVGPAPSVAQTTMCTGTIANGIVPVCDYTFTAPGTYTVIANYALGDSNFSGCASPSSCAVSSTQTVSAASTSVVLTSSTGTPAINQQVTLTAAVNTFTFSGGPVPQGTMAYTDSVSGNLCTTTLTSAGIVPACTYTFPGPPATHTITATFTTSNTNFNTSPASNAVNEVVSKTATTTSVASTPNPSAVNQQVAFLATVTPAFAGTTQPTGTVSFTAIGPSPSIAQTAMCTETISGGAVPVCNYTFAASGTYTVVATYNVLTDPNFTTSSSPSSGVGADIQTVNAGSNSVVLSSSLNPSVVNQPVTLNATISVSNSGSAQPTGSVVYADGGTAIPGCTFGSTGSPVTFTGGIVPSCTVGFSSAATHSIVATFTSANSNFTSGASNTVPQVVNKATPVTSVASLPNPAAVGATVTATATVTSPFTAGTAIPSGNVTFATTPATTTCTETIVAGVVPTCSFTFTSKNSYVIVATYLGDSNFAGSASPSSGPSADVEAVGVEATTVTLTSTTPPTSVVNQSVTFTATINLTAGTTTNPTGTVIFKDGATVLCTVGSSGSPATFTGGAVPSCTATLFTATSSTVTHAITASYSGDSNFGPSTGNLTQTVNPAATTTTIVSTVASVASNSAPLNTPVTYSATVTPTPAPTAGSLSPTGTVTFQYAGTNGTLPVAATNLCPPVGVTAASGTATAACVGLLPTAGTYAVTATYNADQNFSGSKTSPANAQTVTKGATTTSVVSSSTTSSVNQSVAFTATVAPSLPGGTAVPTGTVSFAAIGPSPSVAQTAMCTETISGGAVPICNYTFTASGTYTVVATYNVLTDPNFTTSASPSSGAGADVQTVNAGSNSVFLSSSLNPSSVNQPVSFNATINVPNSGTAQPIGSVVYADGGTALPGCTFGSVGTPVTFTNGIVSPCQVPLSSVATHSIVATFTSANSNFTSGASNTISQVVNKATPVTSVVSSPNPSAVNTQVTATATLTLPFTAGTALPSGNVTFATTPATTTCTETIAAGIVPSCSFTFTSKNNYTIVATYPGDSNFNGSASPSSGTGADVQTVSVQTTTVTLTSTLPPPAGSTVNEPVTFNATINLTAGTTTKPTGTVTYYDGATVLCTSGSSSSPATFAGGTVPSCAATLVTGGIHPITAVYSGDSNFSGSTSLILSQNVAAASTATSFTSAPAAVDVNTQVTYTVHIVPTPAGISTSKNPTGTVTFNYTTTPLAGSAPGTPATSGNLCPPTVAVTALTTTPPTYGEATASCTVTLATSGQYTITANYVSGDNNFTGSTVVSSPFTVGATPTTVSLSSSLPTASGAVVSQLVTFTARVVSGKPGPVAPNGTVVFSSTDAANTAGNCGAQPVTAVPNLASPSTGLDGIAHCSVQFPITEQFTAPISITATYVPATSPQDFGASLNTISQTVQNYSVAFTAPGVSSTPPALAPIFVTQGFSNTSDPFNPKTNIAAAVTTSGGFTGGFSDSLNVTCSVTAVAAIPSAGIISGQAVSDPTCAPASQTLATSSATSSYPLTYTVSASATAPIGAYYVTIRVTDSGPQANGNTGAAYSLSETTTTNPIVYVVGESTSLTLAQGAVGVANAVFNTEAAASGSSLVSYACGKVFSTKTGIIANPSSAPVVTCNGPTTTVGAGSNPPSSSLTTVPIQVSLASSATAQLHRSNTVSLAALLGVPLLALVGWLGSRKSPRRNFFRFIGLILLMVGVSYAVTGCGGSFTQTGSQVSSGGLGTNDSPYLVQVIAYDGPNQTGNEYFAVVPLTVNANSSN